MIDLTKKTRNDYLQATVDKIAEDLLRIQELERNQAQRESDSVSDMSGRARRLGAGSSAATSNVTGLTDSYTSIDFDYNNNGLSSVELAILRSNAPIEISGSEEITVNGERGIWANKSEELNWKGSVPLNQYTVNEDANPQMITKRSEKQLIYQQEVAIRYLRPPTPPTPGDIIVTQEDNIVCHPAPPLIIRQQPARPATPQPLVVREAPPQLPPVVGRKIITISGRKIPPPPRKVIIERLAPLPSKPQSVIIERWLPYTQGKRRVIFQKASQQPDAIVAQPKNVVIQWESPKVEIKKEFKDLGVIRADPAEYVQRYGTTLKTVRDLPSFVLEIKPPAGVVLASDYTYKATYDLEGDLEALKLVDLDREGLSEYKSVLEKLPSITKSQFKPNEDSNEAFTSELFGIIEKDNNKGKVSVDEAKKILRKLNSRLGRDYSETEMAKFFSQLENKSENFIDMKAFKAAFKASL